MTIGTPTVQIKEIRDSELPDAEFDSPRRLRGSEVQGIAIGVDSLIAKRNDLPQQRPGDIGSASKVGVTYNVKIGESSQAQGIADSTSNCTFNVEEDFRGRPDLIAEI